MQMKSGIRSLSEKLHPVEYLHVQYAGASNLKKLQVHFQFLSSQPELSTTVSQQSLLRLACNCTAFMIR